MSNTTNMKKRTASKAVIYARARVLSAQGLSRDSQADVRLAHQQLECCEQEAARLGASVVQEYIDLEASANDQQRPGLVALLERLQAKGDVDYVIVSAADRLARTVEDELALVQEFEANGAQLVIVGQGAYHLSAAAEAVQATQEIFRILKRRELSDAAKRGWVTRRAKAGT